MKQLEECCEKWGRDRQNNIVLMDAQYHPNTFFIILFLKKDISENV